MLTRVSNRRRQRGAALLMMMLVIIVGAAAILVTKLDRNAAQSIEALATQSAMATARNALLDFAGSFPDLVPGDSVRLPCPDIDAGGSTLDGEAHTLDCGGPGETVIGRLPWKSLGIPAQTDSAGECLWYVVSGEYKNAGPSTSAMINPDSNGQLQLYVSETNSLVEGATPDSRPVAMILAPQDPLAGQSRQVASQPGQQCSDYFSATSYLDADPGTGISNAVVGPGVVVDQLVRSLSKEGPTNDLIMTIRRDELADLVYERHDFDVRMQSVTHAVASCIAAYGLSNPGGPNDRRLPWPAPVALTDYRLDDLYDDAAGIGLSGRVSNVVDDSNVSTGNSIDRVIDDCTPASVPEWNAEMLTSWRNWKDHFFYYVAESFSPESSVPSKCVDCISVNSAGKNAAVILFANRRLAAAGQVRNAPPLDPDTKSQVMNYLEGRNETSHPHTGGPLSLESRPADSSFNDILYCIDSSLAVAAC